MDTLRDDIRFFIDDPSRPPSVHQRGGLCSVLYLLRRELIETMGHHPDLRNEADVAREGGTTRAFASLILMFTLIDLLAKFRLGDDTPIGVGKRFKDFLTSPEGGA